jgi:hypothetical protein
MSAIYIGHNYTGLLFFMQKLCLTSKHREYYELSPIQPTLLKMLVCDTLSDYVVFQLCALLLQYIIFLFIYRGELVSLADIENIYKKRRHDKQMRQECVKVNKFNVQFSMCLLRSVISWRAAN